MQIADASGRVTFTSICPACYDGRWPHIHFEVYPDQAAISDSTSAIATSQVALPKDVCEQVYAEDGYESSVSTLSRVSLEDDNVFGDDDGASQLGTVTAHVGSGYTVTLSGWTRRRGRPAAAHRVAGAARRRAPRRPDPDREGEPAMNLGPVEIGLIVLAVMLLFGYKKLPDASRSLGRSLRIFKSEVDDLRTPAPDPAAAGPYPALSGDHQPRAHT